MDPCRPGHNILCADAPFTAATKSRGDALRVLPAKSKHGFYQRLAVYGQMGRTDLKAPWEKTDKADELK